jgi:hypothetical protein
MKPGDTFICTHPDGRYGAVRVLRMLDKSILIYTSQYLDERPPLGTDARLRKPLVQKRFLCGGSLAMRWVRGKTPSPLKFLCNLPPTDKEAATECNVYGAWGHNAGFEAYLEWRWLHDRPALEEEVRQDQERRLKAHREKLAASKPKKMMAEDEFWLLIGLLDWDRTGDDAAVIEPVVQALSLKTKPAIGQFQERLAFLLWQMDTKAHASHIGTESYVEGSFFFSADWFLYVRCAAVANGKAFYDAALADPTNMPKDLEFEALLSVAAAAWERKTGGELDHDTGCSYESFSNLAGWK